MASVTSKANGFCGKSGENVDVDADEDDEIDIIDITEEEEKVEEKLQNESNGNMNDDKKMLSTKEISPSPKHEQESTKGNDSLLLFHENGPIQTKTSALDTTHLQDKLESEISKTFNLDKRSLNTDLNSLDMSVHDNSSNSSTSCSSRSSRKSSINSTDNSKNNIDLERQEECDQEVFGNTVPGTRLSDDDDDEDEDDEDFKSKDPYERFFFESDYLALKDNKHYNLLLQTLVALEAKRMQAIKDLDILCEEEAKALDDPIGFVEKLQNNEPLGLPEAQNVIKLPNVPWEVYASSIGPLEDLSAHPNTRATIHQVEKVQPIPPNITNTFVPEKTSASNKHSEIIFSEAARSNVSGDDLESSKVPTFNQPWTVEEQTRLEKLLQVYPQEEVESKRWEKIAKALGNRTPKQVASRIQKYFIKLTRAGLPVPGRVPNLPKSGTRMSKRSSYYTTVGFRNSTFFPSYQPRVYMDDNKDEDDESSVAFSDETPYLSDDELIPEELRHTNEYKELLELKKVKQRKLQHVDQQQTSSLHSGYMCDGCGVSPIIGSRWHCQDCPEDECVDFCSLCIEKGMPESRGHSRQHRLELVLKDSSFFVDGDYVGMSGSTTGYNYLDPNFLPAAS